MTVTVKKAAVKADVKPKAKIGDVARAAIMDGKTNEQALAEVLKKFPGANTKISSINWYRTELRNDGKKVPTLAKKATAPKLVKKAAPKAPVKVAPKAPAKAPTKSAPKAPAKPVAPAPKAPVAPKAPAKSSKLDDSEGGFD